MLYILAILWLLLYIKTNLEERDLVYKNNMTLGIDVNVFDPSKPPEYICEVTSLYVKKECFWINLPPTKQQMWIYTKNPFIGFILDNQLLVALFITVIGVLINVDIYNKVKELVRSKNEQPCVRGSNRKSQRHKRRE